MNFKDIFTIMNDTDGWYIVGPHDYAYCSYVVRDEVGDSYHLSNSCGKKGMFDSQSMANEALKKYFKTKDFEIQKDKWER